jgi:hypothetical protein
VKKKTTRTPWPHKKKARRIADCNRQHKHRAKYKSLTDFVLSDELITQLLERNVRDDIRKKAVKQLIRSLEEGRRRDDQYSKAGRLIIGADCADCKHAFVLDVTTDPPQMACRCFCKKAKRLSKADFDKQVEEARQQFFKARQELNDKRAIQRHGPSGA